MGQDSLAVHQRHKSDFFVRAFKFSQSPDLCHEFVARSNRSCESGAELLQVRRIAVADCLQNGMRSTVVRKQAVHDRTAKAKGFAGLLCDVQAIVVSIETVFSYRYIR